MAISFVAVDNAAGTANGSTGSSTAALTPALPTGTASGDRVYVIQCHNVAAGSASTPAGWTVVGTKDSVVGSGAVAAGSGMRYLTVYYRDYDGSWSMPSFALISASGPTHWMSAVTLRKTSSAYLWNAPTISTVGTDFGTANTAHTAATGSFTTTSGAFLIVPSVFNDNVTAASPTLTQTGATFASLTERADGGSATGNDVAGKVHTASVTTGATNTLTHGLTLSAASQGGHFVVQQRESVIALFSTFSDDFDAGIDSDWQAGGGAPASVTASNGAVRIDHTATGQYNDLTTQSYYNLTGSAAYVKVADFGSPFISTHQVQMILYDSFDPTDQLCIGTWAGNLYCERVINGSPTTVASLTLDRVAHRWWRIREASGTTYWDTSPDGTTWTNRASVANPIAVTTLKAQLVSGAYGAESAGTYCVFDNFNTTPTAKAKIATRIDNFDSGFATNWQGAGSDGAQVTALNGTVKVAHTSAVQYNWAETLTEYDWIGSSAYVKIIDFGNQANANHVVGLRLGQDGNNNYHMYAQNGQLQWIGSIAGSGVGPDTGSAITLDYVNHRWFKVSESGGVVSFATSPDGSTWTTRFTKAVSFDLTAQKALLTSFQGTATSASYGIFDNFNTVPSALPKTSTLTDPFITLDTTTKWFSTAGTSIVSGRLNVTVTNTYQNLWSQASYDLRDSSVSVEIAQILPASSSEMGLRIGMLPNEGVGQLNLLVAGGNIHFKEYDGTTDDSVAIAYDSTAHRFVRIREAAGTIYWETSPDSVNWTIRRTRVTPHTWDACQVVLITGYTAGTATAIYDNINIYRTAALSDNFTTKDTTKWIWGSTADVASGRLSLPVGSVPNVESVKRYDLTSSSAAVQLVQVQNAVANAGATALRIKAYGAGDNDMLDIGWWSGGNYLFFKETINDVPNETTLAYDPAVHKWLRIREASGSVYWETSVDGVTWTTRRSKTTDAGFNPGNVSIGLFNDGNSSSGTGTALFDNINGVPIDTFTDNFSTQDATKWTYSAGASATGGKAQIVTPGGGAYNVIRRANYLTDRFDLTESAAFAEVTHTVSTGAYYHDTWITCNAGNDSYADMVVESNNNVTNLYMREHSGAYNSQTGITYDATAHRWLRIRHSGTTLYWDTSPDGLTWTNRRSKTQVNNYTNIFPELGASADAASSGSTSTFDNFNVTPSSAVTGDGTRSVTATITGTGVAAATGAGTRSVTATATGSGVAAVSGAGTRAVTATITGSGVVAVSGAGTRSVTATATGSGVAAVTGAGTRTATATITGSGVVAVAGAGTRSVTATITGSGATELTGAGSTLSVAATATGSGVAAATGAGTSTVTATITGSGVVTATITGAGTSTATATITGTGVAAATGAGTETVTATIAGSGSTGLSAAGSALSVAATITGSGARGFTGAGDAVTTAAITGAGTATGAGTETVTADITGSGATGLTGAGSALTVTAAPSGTGQLGTVGAASMSATATISGSGVVAVSGAATRAVTATITGSGAVAVTGAGSFTATAIISGTNTGAFDGTGTCAVTATITGSGVVARAAAGSRSVTATITGSGVVAALGSGTRAVVATITGAGVVAVAGGGSRAVTATATGSGAVSSPSSGAVVVSATISGDGVVACFGEGTLTAIAVIRGGELPAIGDIPASSIVTLLREIREITMAAESRRITMPAETRTITIPGESHTATITEERRSITLPQESRVTTLDTETRLISL